MMNKFEVKNMDLYYGSFHALKNINIAIPEKEITVCAVRRSWMKLWKKACAALPSGTK